MWCHPPYYAGARTCVVGCNFLFLFVLGATDVSGVSLLAYVLFCCVWWCAGVCGDVRWCVVVCCGVWWCVVVCGGGWWCVVECGGVGWCGVVCGAVVRSEEKTVESRWIGITWCAVV